MILPRIKYFTNQNQDNSNLDHLKVLGKVAEGKASLNGLKNMKKLGASKELIKESRKRLGAAWGTYAGRSLINNIAAGEGSVIYKNKKYDNTKN